MGAYMLKVSTIPVGTLRGEPVYGARFAYKAWRGRRPGETRLPADDEDRRRVLRDVLANARMRREFGTAACEAAWEREGLPTRDVLVVRVGPDGHISDNEPIVRVACWGSLVDDELDVPAVARWGDAYARRNVRLGRRVG